MKQKKWAVLYELHYETLLSITVSHLDNPSDAQDCVQDTFLLYMEQDSIHQGTVSLWEVLEQVICAYNQRDKDCISYDEAFSETPTGTREQKQLYGSFSQQNIRQYTPSYIQKVMSGLPAGERRPMELYFYQDMTTKEIGEQLSISHDTVRKRLQRGRKHLKQRLEKKVCC